MDKTIKMPSALLADWLATLRSGEVKQTKGRLVRATPSGVSMCCLGVLQYCAGGHSVQAVEDVEVPSFEWLEKNSVEFNIPADIGEVGLCCVPYVKLDGREWIVSVLNDGDYEMPPKNFGEIADLIEARAEGV